MSKITFRADDDLVTAVEDLDASKSEVMRDALRAYFHETGDVGTVAASISSAVGERVEDHVDQQPSGQQAADREVTVRITLEAGEGVRAADASLPDRERGHSKEGAGRQPTGRGGSGQDAQRDAPPQPGRDAVRGVGPGDGHGSSTARKRDEAARGTTCAQCGETVSAAHTYCPNCGEKATQRLFCECGDEVRSDWAFCPHCGRRTASADVLDR